MRTRTGCESAIGRGLLLDVRATSTLGNLVVILV